jgi:hypothetical protein
MRNMIDIFKDDNNVKLTKIEEIDSWATAYFKNSYKEGHRNIKEEDRRRLINSITIVISVEENEELT